MGKANNPKDIIKLLEFDEPSKASPYSSSRGMRRRTQSGPKKLAQYPEGRRWIALIL